MGIISTSRAKPFYPFCAGSIGYVLIQLPNILWYLHHMFFSCFMFFVLRLVETYMHQNSNWMQSCMLSVCPRKSILAGVEPCQVFSKREGNQALIVHHLIIP